MLNMVQLKEAMDSMKRMNIHNNALTSLQLNTNHYARALQYLNGSDTLKKKTESSADFYALLPGPDRTRVLESAVNIARTARTAVDAMQEEQQMSQQTLRKFEVELHKKFTLSIACLLLFFIGAPLGAIIRKGGLGMPVVVSVLFFLVFYVISITGERLAKEGSLSVAKGMWLAPLLFLPIGIFLTFKASTDSSLFDPATYFTGLKKMLKRP
jgi:lipopolysaccharide export system permease protein